MTVTIKHPFQPPKITDLADHVFLHVDDSTDSVGALETVERETRALCQSYGRLLEVLAGKGLLTVDELNNVIGSRTQIVSIEPSQPDP